MVKGSEVMKFKFFSMRGQLLNKLIWETDNANILVLAYHQTESTVTSLSDLWLIVVKGQKSSIMGSYLEISHYMLSICYKCKLHRPN